MDRLNKHLNIVKSVITEIYDNYTEGTASTEHLLVQDEESRNYLLLMNSWMHGSRFYGILIHILHSCTLFSFSPVWAKKREF
ncbi:MAG: element excision factor XisI family protein [Bacteroidota bacterium]